MLESFECSLYKLKEFLQNEMELVNLQRQFYTLFVSFSKFSNFVPTCLPHGLYISSSALFLSVIVLVMMKENEVRFVLHGITLEILQ
jgi:hypothetical protein